MGSSEYRLSLQTNTEHFKPLIKTKCNRNIQFFVCSVFAPMCPEGMPQAVTSCRSVCEQPIEHVAAD
ncbi:hypothetical protein OESDEN_04156 [Oesophagostomum dentatum]|uniref:FZ domain-containing protein n=1 Tax=Oesophagostomum dentatum TaxID=61180 RepID=A0A0B1TJ85_OESDE|nr:hypothetical protein OESDEN_04156 [Oesophagostomum dentatum]